MVIRLLPYMWRAWWRKTKQRGIWHGANTATVTFIAMITMFGVLVASIFGLRAFNQGNPGQATVLLESCLNTVLMGWLFVPVMVGASSSEGRGLQPVRMGQFPLSQNRLLAIGALGHLVQPIYWVLILGSLAALIPLLAASAMVPGLVAGVLFLLFAGLLSWSVELFGSALFSTRHGREILMVVALLLLVPLLILINADFEMVDGHIFTTVLGREYLLLSEDGSLGLLVNMRAYTPSVLVSDAAQGRGVWRGLLLLGAGVALTGWLSRVSLRRVMLNPPGGVRARRGRVRGIFGWSWLPADIAPLVVKELRYLTRTLDHLMGMGMGLVGLVWILVKPEHMIFVLPLAMINIVFNESAIPLNVFGLDGPGHDRYRLLPIGSARVLWSKNLAYLLVVALQIAPLVLAGLLRGAFGLTLACLLGTAAVCLLTAGGGNLTSIKSPAPRAFFNFDSKEQTGGGLTLFLAALIWVVPAILYFGLVWVSIWAVVPAMLVFLIVSWFLYRFLLGKAAPLFEAETEKMRERLGVE